MTRSFATLLGILLSLQPARADKLVLVAGGGTETDNVPATRAKLIAPFGVDFDKSGNMYIVELSGQRFLRVDGTGTLKILGGTESKKGDSGDGGPVSKALFNAMHSLAIAPDGAIYLADTLNHRVRRYDPKTGIITAFAGTGKKGYGGDGGPALQADFDGIYCIALDFSGTKLYAADLENRRIRVVDLKSGMVDLVAGSGRKMSTIKKNIPNPAPEDGADAKTAPLVDPRAVCVDRKGNVYVLERSGHALRVVDPQGKIRTVVGTGKAGPGLGDGDPRKAQLNGPKHLCVDLEDNVILADTANHRILKYEPKAGKISVIAGNGKRGKSGDGGPALEVSLDDPHGVCVHPSGTVYVVDSNNNRVFRLEK